MPPDAILLSSEAMPESSPMEQFRLVFTIYFAWSALAWLSHVAGAMVITPRTAAITLFGIGATNALFFMVARSNALHRPPDETITLAQCVVGIAWATLFTFMSSGFGELAIGIYVSIVLFAMLRVRRSVLNQIIVFAASSYSIVTLVKMLSTEPPSISPTSLVQVLIFAGIMLCLSGVSRYVYHRYRLLETKFTQLQVKLQREHAGTSENSFNRRYILDLLAREKGRTDRSNVPFCICVFNADHIEPSCDGLDEGVKTRALKTVESIIRAELRDMDSLNSTGFHDCFGTYSDKELIAVLPQTNLAGARYSAERALAAITACRNTDDGRVEVCGGIAEYRRGEHISALLARAEEALGKARASGASCIGDSEDSREKRVTHHAAIVRLETRRR